MQTVIGNFATFPPPTTPHASPLPIINTTINNKSGERIGLSSTQPMINISFKQSAEVEQTNKTSSFRLTHEMFYQKLSQHSRFIDVCHEFWRAHHKLAPPFLRCACASSITTDRRPLPTVGPGGRVFYKVINYPVIEMSE